MRKIVLIFLMLAAMVNATVYYVRPTNGSDSNSGDSFAQAFKTTQKALDTCTSGNEIRLIPEATESISAQIDADTNSGTATAPIVIRVGNTTNGEYDASLTYTIQAAASINSIIEFTAVCDFTRWEGVVFDGNSNATYGLFNNADGSDYHFFSRCTFKNATHGIAVRGSGVWGLIGCSITNNTQHGIYLFTANRGNIVCSNSVIANNGYDGIYCQFGIRVSNTLFYRNRDGIYFHSYYTGAFVSNCTFADNRSDGVAFVNLASYSNCILAGCQFVNNAGYGININAQSQYIIGDMSGCNFYNNTSGATSVTINAWPYTTYDPKFVNTEAGTEDYRVKGSLYAGFPTVANGMLTGACTVYNGWPALSDVKSTASVDGVSGTLDMSLYTLISGLVGPEWVVFGHDLRSGVPGEFRASDFANCEAGNIKNGVTIDDVTGTYTGSGGGSRPASTGGGFQ